jgi:hypothetical protein
LSPFRQIATATTPPERLGANRNGNGDAERIGVERPRVELLADAGDESVLP